MIIPERTTVSFHRMQGDSKGSGLPDPSKGDILVSEPDTWTVKTEMNWFGFFFFF